MIPMYKKGFTFLKGKGKLLISAIHAGADIHEPNSRDENSDVISSMVWNKLGGSLIIAHTARNPFYGINLNRALPSFKFSKEYFNYFQKTGSRSERFESEFAFASKNFLDYLHRRSVYVNFWKRHDSDIIFFIHTSSDKMKNYPGIIDVTIFNGYIKQRLSSDQVKSVISKLNEKHKNFFDSLVLPPFVKSRERPKLTYENFFNGEMCHGPRNMIKNPENKIVVMFEVMKFLALEKPLEVAQIISDFYILMNLSHSKL